MFYLDKFKFNFHNFCLVFPNCIALFGLWCLSSNLIYCVGCCFCLAMKCLMISNWNYIYLKISEFNWNCISDFCCGFCILHIRQCLVYSLLPQYTVCLWLGVLLINHLARYSKYFYVWIGWEMYDILFN